MLPLFWTLLWAALAVLGAVAGIRVYARRRRELESARTIVDDEAVRRILETGVLTVEDDEPLDLDAIEAEEKRFWSEMWDEPGDEWLRR
jgi:hypothetical protein